MVRIRDKILKGAKAPDLPIEQPRQFEFVVNLKAAKQIGLTIPPNVLALVPQAFRLTAHLITLSAREWKNSE